MVRTREGKSKMSETGSSHAQSMSHTSSDPHPPVRHRRSTVFGLALRTSSHLRPRPRVSSSTSAATRTHQEPSGSLVKSKPVKKSYMVFPTRCYPSRTRYVVKDTHPPFTNQNGKRKVNNDTGVDPDFVIVEPNSPDEPVASSRPIKKQNRSVSTVAKAVVSSPKYKSSAEASSDPLTSGSTAKMGNFSRVNIGSHYWPCKSPFPISDEILRAQHPIHKTEEHSLS